MQPTTIELIATVCFALAVVHTFTVNRFEHWADRQPANSILGNLFHILGEVEVVFGLWAGIFVVLFAIQADYMESIKYLESLNFTEPAFVFVIMTIAATVPIIYFASGLIRMSAKFLPLPQSVRFFVMILIMGPLLGSFITEPAAMTVTALILKNEFFDRGISTKFKYALLGVLFVNISIGGTLTHFAAPPVLMVAGKWNWDMGFMFFNFGWKAAIAVVINALALAFVFKNELAMVEKMKSEQGTPKGQVNVETLKVPTWLIGVHLLFLAVVVAMVHHMVIFLGIFLFFLGVTTVTNKYQEMLKMKEGLLVGFFLGGLVVLGGMQAWWLKPLLSSLGEVPLYLGTTALTAITDNAALTYLGAQVDGLTASMKYALVAGAVTGGGLTVIANAPNPAGFGILKNSFGEDGINPLGLLLGALAPTAVALVAFWFLPQT